MRNFKKLRVLLASFLILFSLSSCFVDKDDDIKTLYQQTSSMVKFIPLTNEFNELDNGPVQNADLVDDAEQIVKTLTSEEFKGRGDDTDGNDKTLEYVKNQFANIGLDYLFKDTYLHKYNFSEGMVIDLFTEFIHTEDEEYNVVGLIKGSNHNERKKAVVITAHIDHIGNGLFEEGEKQIHPGAIDNASGTAALLRIAYKLKEMSKEELFETDIIIAGVNHEELGLVGSTALVKDIKDRYESIYNINIDCVGVKDGAPLIVYSSNKRSPELSKLIFKYMDSINDDIKKDTKIRYYNSDHVAFECNGIQSVFFMDEGSKDSIHKPTDTEDKIDYKRLENVVDYICGFVKENDKNVIPKRKPLVDE